MTIQNIIFKHTNVGSDAKLEALVTEKLAVLNKYLPEGSDVTCEVEFERIPSHQSGKIYRLETNLRVSGTLYRAEAVAESFEVAVDLVKSDLDAEMNKAHKKKSSLLKQGGRAIKDMLRFGK